MVTALIFPQHKLTTTAAETETNIPTATKTPTATYPLAPTKKLLSLTKVENDAKGKNKNKPLIVMTILMPMMNWKVVALVLPLPAEDGREREGTPAPEGKENKVKRIMIMMVILKADRLVSVMCLQRMGWTSTTKKTTRKTKKMSKRGGGGRGNEKTRTIRIKMIKMNWKDHSRKMM